MIRTNKRSASAGSSRTTAVEATAAHYHTSLHHTTSQPVSTSRRDVVRTRIVDLRTSVSTLQLRSATLLGVLATVKKALNVQIYMHTNVPTSPTKASAYAAINAHFDTSIARLECGKLLATPHQKDSHEHLLQRPRAPTLKCRRLPRRPCTHHRCSHNRSITYHSTSKIRYRMHWTSTLNLCRPPSLRRTTLT